ncbi:hypothetical protein NDU88_003153 [Pleurodeles waltl]|uniref:Uncharacterized protein n=1 Tax=Pleurodeles waltl TaxID=8319 RepID=A0AAV7TN61_PLEWA|nr:hypothetical protein NDU88_003153 [Pleurodeles waltl]
MCTPQLLRPEAIWRTAGAVWWHRAALELRRTRKSVARIPLRGNSGSGSCSSRTGGAAPEKWRPGEQPKENPEKDARKKTVRQRGVGSVFPAPTVPLNKCGGVGSVAPGQLGCDYRGKGGQGRISKKINPET